MRILVTGGRNYHEDEVVFAALKAVRNIHHGSVTLIVGDASGADLYARRSGYGYGWNVRVFQADWETHGKAAGPIRNQQMIDDGQPHLCFAFPGGAGTNDCVKRCRAAGIPVMSIDELPTTEELEEFILNGLAPN